MPKSGWWLECLEDDPEKIREEITMPPDHEAYLNQDQLQCLFNECGWVGKSLSNHLIMSHQVDVRAFKMAAGFDLGDGLVCRTTRDKQRDNPNAIAVASGRLLSYITGTTREHWLKSYQKGGYVSIRRRRKLSNTLATFSKVGYCIHCGKEYNIHNTGGYPKFCSSPCRTAYHYHDKSQGITAPCGFCGKIFYPTQGQTYRMKKNYPVFCSMSCRQKYNSKKKKGGARVEKHL